jgi:hypothetical protein
MTLPTDLREVSVTNLTIGRMDQVHFIEEAAAAGFGAVGLLLVTVGSGPHYRPLPEKNRSIG